MPDKFVRVQAAGTPATIAEAKWEKRAEELSFTALASVRSVAEKWTGTIASLLAIFSIVTLVKGPSDLAKVEGSFAGVSLETWVIALLGVAVLLGAAATVLAAMAAYGLPRDFRFVGAEVRKLHREEATTASRNLEDSRYFAVASVVVLAVAVGVAWLNASEDATSPAKTVVIDGDGIAACGQLMPSTQSGQLAIVEKGKENATPVPLDDVRAIGAISACPGE